MNGIDRSRQYDLFRPEQAMSPVTVIGVGGIGSAVTLTLAKMGAPEIIVLDDDIVEAHNLASQWYRLDDIGKPKVIALAEAVKSFAGCAIEARQERYDGQPLSGLVISAVDSMDTRKIIWEQARLNPEVELFIDTRMGGNVALMLSARPCDGDDIRHYEQHLFPSSEASVGPCTARAIVYNTLGVASMVAALVRRWWVEGERVQMMRMDFGTHTFL